MSILNEKDFVYTRDDDGNVQSGGYKIESLLLEKGIPIKPSSQQIKQKGGGTVVNVLADLAVPAGLLYMQQNVTKHYDTKNYSTVPVDLYDKLIELSKPKKPKNKSLKRSYKAKNKTRKNKN